MRSRFKRSACGSSRGGYVYRSHIQYLQECHANIDIEISIKIPVREKKRYYVKCFGKLIEITEREALMRKGLNIIIK